MKFWKLAMLLETLSSLMNVTEMVEVMIMEVKETEMVEETMIIMEGMGTKEETTMGTMIEMVMEMKEETAITLEVLYLLLESARTKIS